MSEPPPTFEQLLAALGRRLDEDAGLRTLAGQLFSRLGGAAGDAEPAPSPAPAPPQAAAAAAPASAKTAAQTVAEPAPQAKQPKQSKAKPQPPEPPPDLATQDDLKNALERMFQADAADAAASASDRQNARAARGGGEVDVALIHTRLGIKRRALRLAQQRAESRLAGEDLPRRSEWYDEVISQAQQLQECYLWMIHIEHVEPAQWARAERCFAALDSALRMTLDIVGDDQAGDLLEEALQLLAEAQSFVRAITIEFKIPIDDSDQRDVFDLLRDLSSSRSIYISRFMRRDDIADPSRAQELLDEVAALASRHDERRRQRASVEQSFSKIRYEAKRLDDDPAAALERWRKIVDRVDQLISGGLPASNARLRDLLLDHLEDMPDEDTLPLPQTFRRFLRAADAYLSAQEISLSGSEQEAAPTAEVKKVRAWLQGGEIVIIGGECRQNARRAIMKAFALGNLNWIETRPHESTAPFEAAVARQEARVVLLAIRWSSHSYGDVKIFCDQYDKPLVRLPRGYGVNQIAAEICKQCPVDELSAAGAV